MKFFILCQGVKFGSNHSTVDERLTKFLQYLQKEIYSHCTQGFKSEGDLQSFVLINQHVFKINIIKSITLASSNLVKKEKQTFKHGAVPVHLKMNDAFNN